MSCEHALNFDQWKTFSENFKPIRVWLWLIYKFTENSCRSRLFSEFIQTQRRYPTSLDKISIQNYLPYQTKIFCELNFHTSWKISHICRCDFKLLLKIRIILSSIKVQLLQKKKKKLKLLCKKFKHKTRQQNFIFHISRPLLKTMGNIESAYLRALSALELCVPCALRAVVPHVPYTLRAVVFKCLFLYVLLRLMCLVS